MPLQITAKKDGFYRCGVRHGGEATTYPDDRFSPEELARLKADPMLVVVELDDEGQRGKGKKG